MIKMDNMGKVQDSQKRNVEILQARITELEEKLQENESQRFTQFTRDRATDLPEDAAKEEPIQEAFAKNQRIAENQLAELNLVYETAPVGLCFMDTQLRFVRINQYLATLHGLSVEAHVGRTLEKVLPHLAPILLPHYQQVLNTKKPLLNLGVRGGTNRPPYHERDWLVSYVPVIENEIVLGITTVVQDITERKQAEDALQEMNVALTHAAPGISLLDKEGRYLQVNGAYANFLGYSPEELLGHPWKPTVHPEDYETAKAAFEVMRATGAGEFEARAIRKDGSMFYKHVVMVRGILKAGSLQSYHCFMRDITKRKQVEESLRASELRLNEAQRLAHVGSWELDLVNNVLTWSDEVFRIFEIEQTQFGASYEAFLDSIHPEDREFVNQKYTESIKQKVPYEVSHRLLMADGRIKFVHEQCETVYDDSGISLRSLGTIQDITDRKNTEENQGYLGRLLEQSLNEIYIFDAQSLQFILVNRGARENLGYSMAELSHLTPVDLKPGFTPESFANLLSPLHTKGKESLQFETVHRRKDGTMYPVEVHLQVATWESKPAVVAMILDITKRNQAEKILRESEESLRSLIEAIPQQVWTAQPDGTLDYVNLRVLEFFEQPFESLIEHGWQEVIHPDDLPICLERWEQSRQTNQPYEIEFRLKRERDQAYRPHIGRALPMCDQDGHVVKWFGTNTDITDLKEMEAQLRQAQKMEAIGTLAGGIAHDFNNVLGIILGYAELAQLKTSGNKAIENHLQEITVAGKRAKDLVHQILTFGRQKQILQQPIDLNMHIREVLNMVRATLPSTIDFRSRFSPEAISILGDPTQLQQVVLNLCSNAEQAMREKGGTLEIGTESLEFIKASHFDQWTLDPGRYIRLWVKDTGLGIPQHLMNRIFDPFFTTKEVGEGTGMGLAVIHGIVTTHQGAISVNSTLGQGTTFDIYFPAQDFKNLPSEKSVPQAVTLKKTARILFVDDEMPLAYFGKEILEALGCDVDICTNGLEALECFQKDLSRYDVVISDQTMPGMTGEKLAQRLLQLRPDLPIILCTGFSYSMTPEKAKHMGIKTLLKKPVLKEDLIATLNTVL